MKLKLDENLSRHLKPVGTHPGIILFRPFSMGPSSVNSFIADFVQSADLKQLASCVAIVDTSHVRVRFPEK